jgi:serine/threonine protein kinase
MTTTEKFQVISDFFLSKEEYNNSEKKDIQTNSRYVYFTQKHFTAGDEDQFEEFRDSKNYNVCSSEKINIEDNIFNLKKEYEIWSKYKNVDATAVINTFRYMFHKFKKGIFVKIADNELKVFLPFSKVGYKNEWSKQVAIDPKFKDLFSFLSHVSALGGYKFHSASVNTDIEQWYGNNCILRYDMKKVGKYYYPAEGDTNIGTIKNMLETLCKSRKIPDIEFFINRRDFPVLTKDWTEPYNNIWDTKDKPLISHNYSKYVPILSMATSNRYADIAIPTYDDWARVQKPNFFPEYAKIYPKNNYWYEFNKNWEKKKPIAVFRGSSTGCGVTIETNPRLKLAYMSHLGEVDENGIPYLDAGITKWNLRPRKVEGEKYLQTIEIDKLPFGKIGFLSPEEQTNYKYIINVDGHVSAFRLSLELVMGSVILMVDSEWEIWYKNMLKPYEHYVPIKKDLSDLIEQIKWCKKNDKKCKKIAENAEKFYFTYLQKDGIVDYLQKTLVDLKNNMGTYLYNTEKPLDIQIREELESFKYTFPITDKNTTNINRIPYIGRCHGLLKGIQWIFNMTMNEKGFEKTANIDETFEIKNKLSLVKKWDLAGFSFIVKSTTDDQKKMEHIHDAYVGINTINNICNLIPNFAYTFGFYEKEDKVNVVMEYIRGQTLYDYIKSADFSFDEYLLILIQLSLALEVAQKNCGLVHYDLTPWNIILQKIEGDPINVDYVLAHDKILRVKTNIIPIIIDYGKSHVLVDEIHHGFINMFNFSTIQDVITILIKSVDQILNTVKLNSQDFSSLIYLMNFITDTKYRKEEFKNALSIKQFIKKAGKYSSLTLDDKYELNNLKPLDFVKYIYKLKSNYPLILNSFGNAKGKIEYIMENANSRQIFDYILSETREEQLNSYLNVFIRLKHCSLPLSDNLLLNYYTAQNLENNLRIVYNNMIHFLENNGIKTIKYKKIFINTMNFIKKVYGEKISNNTNKSIEYSIENIPIEIPQYSVDIFLEPEKVLEYINMVKNIEINVMSDYKDIIESVLVNKGEFSLSSEDKLFYMKNFKKLLTINTVEYVNDIANIKTIKMLAQKIYSKDKEYLLKQDLNCNLVKNYLKLYNEIIEISN